MAIASGKDGSVTWANGTGETATVVAVATIMHWEVYDKRVSVDRTPLNSRFFKPGLGQEDVFIRFRAWIDQATSPGGLNQVPATIKLYPKTSDTGKYWEVTGLIEDYRVISDVDNGTIIEGVAHGASQLALNWA